MRGWQTVLLALIAGIIGMATGSRPVQIAALALAALLVVGIGYRILLIGDVAGSREVSDAIVSWGEALTQKITLTNRARLGIPAIRITDQSTLPNHPRGYVTALQAKRTISWELDIPCQRRGRYRLGPVEAHMSDPLGMFPVRKSVGEVTSVLVLPRWVPLKRTALKLDGFMPGEARGKRRGESPPSVVSIREYNTGDSVSAIHWPATVRSGTLMTKLFDPEIQTTLWIALDLDGNLAADEEELLVVTAASLGMYALHQANLRLGLVASGDAPILMPSERGKRHQYRLQELLAEAHSGTRAQLAQQFNRVEQRLGPGQVVTLLTRHGPPVWGSWLHHLMRRGVAVRVVQVQAATGDGAEHGSAWPVPSVWVPMSMLDLDQQGALISRLEGGDLGMKL
jgi:uncharacterized protein (DUF58 family)